jgi:cytochrome c-type biogenesis protein CcmH/NrfF
LAVILFVLLIFSFAISACTSNTSSPTPSATAQLDGATLVQARCSRCHPLSRVESARHTAAEWKTTVDKMVRRGARLTPEEETIVVDYLASNFGK